MKDLLWNRAKRKGTEHHSRDMDRLLERLKNYVDIMNHHCYTAKN